MADHIHECPSGANKGMRIVLEDQVSTFGEVSLGSMWCWSHAKWEEIPAWWREEHKQTRILILLGWSEKKFDYKTGKTAYPEGFEESIRKYCALTSWFVPDISNISEIRRFVDDVASQPWRDNA